MLLKIIKHIYELKFWKNRFKDTAKYGENFYQSGSMQRAFKTYCHFLGCNKDSFADKIIVDIGCGPMGSLHLFNAKLKIGVDPLARKYNKQFGLSDHDMLYLSCPSENIPIVSESVDVVISKNALDHVDNFHKTIDEIHRILKPEGSILFSINVQEKRNICEPIVLNEKIIQKVFNNKFDYTITRKFPKGYVLNIDDEDITHDYEILVIEGKKV